MSVVFADTWKSHVATYTKTPIITVIEENYYSNKFLNYLLVELTKFPNGIH